LEDFLPVRGDQAQQLLLPGRKTAILPSLAEERAGRIAGEE